MFHRFLHFNRPTFLYLSGKSKKSEKKTRAQKVHNEESKNIFLFTIKPHKTSKTSMLHNLPAQSSKNKQEHFICFLRMSETGVLGVLLISPEAFLVSKTIW